MTIPKEIIELAIKGRWWPEGINVFYTDAGKTKHKTSESVYFELYDTDMFYKTICDPLFWQALGRAKGWEPQEFTCRSGCGCPYPRGNGSHERECVWEENDFNCLAMARTCFSLLMQGKDTTFYWQEILNQ